MHFKFLGVSFELTKTIYWKWCDIYTESCAGRKCAIVHGCWMVVCCIAFGGSVEILQYIMEKITIFLISFNSHYISFHSSVFFLFEMCRWISKKQINYSLALPVSHKHLVNIIFISVISLSLSLSLSLTLSSFLLWFLFVAFTISACPISVESKKNVMVYERGLLTNKIKYLYE